MDRHYPRADPATWASAAARPGREVLDQRFRIVHAARPHPGMRVADFGADIGPFAVLFARAVGPEGRVYATGIPPSSVPALAALARGYRVDNIVPIVESAAGTGLEGGSIDLAFLRDVYGRFAQPRTMLDSIYQALVPYGILILVERRREADSGRAGVAHRVGGGRDRMVSEVEAAGFRLVEEPDFLEESDFLRFEKVGDEPDMDVGPIETDAAAPGP